MIEPASVFREVIAALAVPRHATYRLQVGSALGFDRVAGLAPYLAALGVSDAYLSPCFKCSPGSTHGYDVTDHNAFNPEIGGEPEFEHMSEALTAGRLGLVLDIVPNHMGIAGDSNPWWLDVLENGPSSPRAPFFDIEWAPVKPELRDKVLLPVLPDQYGRVLESQGLQVELIEGAFVVRHAGGRLPLSPDTYPQILSPRLDELAGRAGGESPAVEELRSILTALEHLPGRTETERARVTERLREKEVIKRRLAALVKDSSEVREFVEENLRALNGTPGDPASFDRLDQLLSAQTYRLAYWRVAGDEVNYRRFFDVNELAAIRMERPEVFEATHELVLRLVGEGKVTGLRIDHPDGLYAPGEYFRRLQEGALLGTARRLHPELGPGDVEALKAQYRAHASAYPGAAEARPLWITAEKILNPGELLPEWWVVAGTTGYDFLASVTGVLVDRGTSRQMTTAYTRFTGATASPADIVYDSKRLIMQVSMASEMNQLGHQLDRLSERNRLSRDFTLNSLIRALRELIAAFPVYRTYVGDDGPEASARDRGYVERAIAEAMRRYPNVDPSVFDFVRDTLLLRRVRVADESEHAERRHFAMSLQQTTGPVTAKGVEDTALYRYNRLVSLNDVGGDPARYGEAPGAFHEKNARRLERWPDALLCTSTHDTKRGEDVRARISVLSEVPDIWTAHARRWRVLARRFKAEADGGAAPDRNDEYLLYQTLVGAWPTREDEPVDDAFAGRIRQYMEKATKEAKHHTSWMNPNGAYDQAVRDFVDRLLSNGPFLDAFRPFQRLTALYGAVNGLAQVVLKIASPGVPDFYQGTELWDLSLVDPDNRRPVDWELRQAALGELQARIAAGPDDQSALCAELLGRWPDGHVKLYVTHLGLTLRRDRRQLFRSGEYRALSGAGEIAEHVLALARVDGSDVVLAAVPRLSARLTGFTGRMPVGAEVWGQTWLSLGDDRLAGVYRDRFSGVRVATEPRDGAPALPLRTLFGALPVALLEREEAGA